MEKIEEFVDERQKSWCIHCTRSLAGIRTNEDHVPTKGFLLKPRPHNLPAVTICTECNTGFSLDEQYAVAFLSCVLAGSTNPDGAVQRERRPRPCQQPRTSRADRAIADRLYNGGWQEPHRLETGYGPL